MQVSDGVVEFDSDERSCSRKDLEGSHRPKVLFQPVTGASTSNPIKTRAIASKRVACLPIRSSVKQASLQKRNKVLARQKENSKIRPPTPKGEAIIIGLLLSTKKRGMLVFEGMDLLYRATLPAVE
uniref:Uncharacterized protein n=1 Tax=Picea glauca TaxID=3330 RepID=A0A101LW88_PICGL|nr:hypothetical protein ABT39_MTgene1586 [Picea glauca]